MSATAGWRPTSWTRRDLELYDEPVEISFVAHIRGMVRFDGVEALIETMRQDVERTREILGLAPTSDR